MLAREQRLNQDEPGPDRDLQNNQEQRNTSVTESLLLPALLELLQALPAALNF